MKGLSRSAKTAVLLSALLLLVCSRAMLAVAQTDNDGSQLRPIRPSALEKVKSSNLLIRRASTALTNLTMISTLTANKRSPIPGSFRFRFARLALTPASTPAV